MTAQGNGVVYATVKYTARQQINESTYPVGMKFKTTDGPNPLAHKTVVISYGAQVSAV